MSIPRLLATKLPSIPSLPPDTPPALSRWMSAVSETLGVREGHRGASLDQNVTFRDLVTAGIAKMPIGSTGAVAARSNTLTVEPAAAPTVEPDLTPPPAVTGQAVTAGLNVFFLSWTAPTYTQGGGHAYVEVWGAQNTGSAPTFANAQLLDRVSANLFAYPAGLGVQWHFWFVAVTKAGVSQTTPTGGTNGLSAQTGKIGNADLGPLIIQAGNLASNAVTAVKIEDNAITAGKLAANSIAVGTAAIQNGAIVNAMIGDAAITSAKIGDAQIVTAKIGDAQITGAKIVNAAITTAHIANAAITNALIADATIATAKIGDAQITDAKIANLSASKINAGSMSAAYITAGTITTDRIVVGAVSDGDKSTTTSVIASIGGDAAASNLTTFTVKTFAGAGTPSIVFNGGNVPTLVTLNAWCEVDVANSSSAAAVLLRFRVKQGASVVAQTQDLRHLETWFGAGNNDGGGHGTYTYKHASHNISIVKEIPAFTGSQTFTVEVGYILINSTGGTAAPGANGYENSLMLGECHLMLREFKV